MFDKKNLNELVRQLLSTLPPSAQKLCEGLDKEFHEILKTAFLKMDLVTREEFDAQVRVLQRLRAKVDALEKSKRRFATETQEKD